MAGRHGCALALALFCTAAAAQQPNLFWDLDGIASFQGTHYRVAKSGMNQTLDLIPAERLRLLYEVKQRIEKEAGVTARFHFLEQGDKPNAHTRTDAGKHTVAMNLAMLNLVGDDADAMAAVLGHEYAHIVLNHREARAEREKIRQVAGIILGGVLAAARVPYGGTFGEAAAGLVSISFTRDEEREADEKGISMAAAAGYSPTGGVRVWARMLALNTSAPIPFFSTHPGIEERIENMRTFTAKYTPVPVPTHVAAANPPAPVTLAELQALEERAAKDQGDARAWQAIGGHYASFGDVQAARRVYWHVVKLEPANLEALEALGALHVKAGARDQAGQVWEELLKVDPKRAEDFFSTHLLP
jgi:predicted Zn-dependent protease